MAAWIVVGVVGLVALGVTMLYNRIVALKNEVEASWRQIDVQLQRRHDLVPNLVQVVQAYAAHERGLLEAVTRARSAAEKARSERDVASVGRAEAALGRALAEVQARVEAYPELKANQQFERLMTELSETENRLAASRRLYNEAVEAYNTAIEQMPAALIASAAGFPRRLYFELPVDAPERAVPRVSFAASPQLEDARRPAALDDADAS